MLDKEKNSNITPFEKYGLVGRYLPTLLLDKNFWDSIGDERIGETKVNRYVRFETDNLRGESKILVGPYGVARFDQEEASPIHSDLGILLTRAKIYPEQIKIRRLKTETDSILLFDSQSWKVNSIKTSRKITLLTDEDEAQGRVKKYTFFVSAEVMPSSKRGFLNLRNKPLEIFLMSSIGGQFQDSEENLNRVDIYLGSGNDQDLITNVQIPIDDLDPSIGVTEQNRENLEKAMKKARVEDKLIHNVDAVEGYLSRALSVLGVQIDCVSDTEQLGKLLSERITANIRR